MQRFKKIYKHCFIFFMTYLTCSVGYCLLVTYLNTVGIQPSKRSLVISLGAICAMFLQTIVGYLCDKTKRIKPFVLTIIILLGLLTYILYNIANNQITILLVIVMLFYMIWKISMAIIDSWALETNEDCRNYYGIIRAFGALGWMVGSFSIGIIVNKFGYQALGVLGVLCALLTIVVSLLTKDAQKQSSSTRIKLTDIKTLLRNKKYLLAILILFFLSIISDSHSYLVIGKINTLTTNSSIAANYWTISAIYELPLMFLGYKACKKFGNNVLLLICCMAYFMKFILYSFATSYLQIYIISVFQSISYPIIELVGKRIIDEQTPLELKSTGLLLAVSIYSCVSSLISPLLCAALEEHMSYNSALLVIGGVALCALMLVISKIKIEEK